MAKKQAQTMGTCRHCGQQMVIHLPEDADPAGWTQEDFDQTATEQCICEGAMSEAQKEEQKKRAVDRMREFYEGRIAEMLTEVRNDAQAVYQREMLIRQRILMVGVVEDVADRVILGASIPITESEVFTIVVKKSGDLQIKRTFKGSEEWIF